MPRYETELDPDARLLPDRPPPNWMTDTLKIFLQRMDTPLNIALETALIAVQERLQAGDVVGADRLLDDIESALDREGRLDRPSLRARRAILAQVALQDRAILRADRAAYLRTVDLGSALAWEEAVDRRLQPPWTAYRQEIVRLDITDDYRSARGVVLVHGEVVDGPAAEDGRLAWVSLVHNGAGWVMSGRELEAAREAVSGPELSPRTPELSPCPWAGSARTAP